MAEFNHPTDSPLFDKMDALLARHRGPGGVKVDIPVLTEEAPVEAAPPIPVLTDVVVEPDTLFDSHGFFTAPASALPIPPAPTEALFLDLPLLDLDGLADNPSGVPSAANLELTEPPLPLAAELPALTLESLDAEQTNGVEAHAGDEFEIAERFAADALEQELSLTEHALSRDGLLAPENTDTALPAPKLTDAAQAEITAAVAAQIAVDISTEVAQLTRQHFASMMNTFYSDSLHKLTEEISRDMEMCLAPRINELVQEELRRQGLLE